MPFFAYDIWSIIKNVYNSDTSYSKSHKGHIKTKENIYLIRRFSMISRSKKKTIFNQGFKSVILQEYCSCIIFVHAEPNS